MTVRTGNGGVDVTRYATAESRRKGGLARAAKIREEKLTVRARLARIAEEEAEGIAAVSSMLCGPRTRTVVLTTPLAFAPRRRSGGSVRPSRAGPA